MDHFPLPKGKGHIRVPNLTRKNYTSGDGGFHGYPSREGWSAEDLEGVNSYGQRSPASIQEFFQNWLFFGFAIEVLAISGVKVEQSGLLDESQQYVSTRRLPFLIRQWRFRILQLGGKNSPLSIDWAMKIALILKKVSSYIDMYGVAIPKGKCGPTTLSGKGQILPLPEKVWMSIIAMGHTFAEAMLSFHGVVRTSIKWGASTLLKRRILSKGWCPMDAQKTMVDLGIDGHYFMAKSENPEVNISHDLCTTNQCLARNIEEVSYQQKHACEDGQCGRMVLVDEVALCKIIDADEIPVFCWNAVEKKLDIRTSHVLKRGRASIPFIAISHVWSDGMGNPHNNGLYECQLNRIQGLVTAATADHTLLGRPECFWLDTLSIPVRDTPEMKKRRMQCIRAMANIYKGASAVLVLSSGILELSTTSPEHERGLALYLANWNRRLWTFQEGMLAEKILLQFSDKTLDSYGIDYPGVNKSIARGHCVTFPKTASVTAMSDFVLLRDFLRYRMFEALGPMQARFGPLGSAIFAIQFRSTSKRSDETICLGALMRLKVSRLLEVEQHILEEYRQRGVELRRAKDLELAERRMETFVSMVRVFPHDIIFNPHTRLTKDGYRWAPSSFLGIPRGGFVVTMEGTYSIFDKNDPGLSFTGSGIIIEMPHDKDHLSAPSDALRVRVPIQGHESVQVVIRTQSVNDQGHLESWMPNTCYGIILRRPLHDEVKHLLSAKLLHGTPTNIVELEAWFESIYPPIDDERNTIDVVVGTIRHDHAKEGSRTDPVVIRHEFLATLTIENPSALLEEDHSSDSDSESDIGDLSDTVGGLNLEASDVDSETSSDEDDDDNLDLLDMSEDFDNNSEWSENSERPIEGTEGNEDSESEDSPEATNLQDLLNDSVSEVGSARDDASDSGSEAGGFQDGPVKVHVHHDADAIQVVGELKGEDTKWFIL